MPKCPAACNPELLPTGPVVMKFIKHAAIIRGVERKGAAHAAKQEPRVGRLSLAFAGSSAPRLLKKCRPGQQGDDQEDHEKNESDKEQYFRDSGRRRSDAGKSEYSGNDRHD